MQFAKMLFFIFIKLEAILPRFRLRSVEQTQRLDVIHSQALPRGSTVVMESTGGYWIPACQILEDKGIEVLLVNPRYAKNVSGRKTDALDCQWLRTLHCYGLLPASFRPVREIVTLRSYLRHRQMLIEYPAAHIQHMQKAMTQMNLQLHHVISDITGLTGMRIIRAIAGGERHCKKLAGMRHERTHANQATIEKALEGDYRTEHLFALKERVIQRICRPTQGR